MSPSGSDSTTGALIALGVYAAMRLIDGVLPGGHHLRWMDRWIRGDNDHQEQWDREDEVRKESRRNQDSERDFHRKHIDDDKGTDDEG